MNASCGIGEPKEFVCLAKLIRVFDRITKAIPISGRKRLKFAPR